MAQVNRSQLIQVARGLQLVPAVAADLSATDTFVFQFVVSNVTGTAATITVKDKQGSPLTLLQTASIAANSTVVYSFPEGALMKGGVNWVAGTVDALHAEICAFKKHA